MDEYQLLICINADTDQILIGLYYQKRVGRGRISGAIVTQGYAAVATFKYERDIQ